MAVRGRISQKSVGRAILPAAGLPAGWTRSNWVRRLKALPHRTAAMMVNPFDSSDRSRDREGALPGRITRHRPDNVASMRPIFLISAISWMLAGSVCAPAQTPEGESVSVVAFGAKGDGVTDDRAAIQAAIDSISSGVVTLPPAPGGYLLSLPPGKTDFLVLKSNVQLVGIGNPVLRVAPSSAPYDHVISSSYCEDCSIQASALGETR